MKINFEQPHDSTHTMIMKLVGDLDASCYLDVIAAARQQTQNGVTNLLLDLGEMNFMSSAGLVALHSILLLLRGEAPANPDEGWSAIHAISHEVEKATEFNPHFKVLNPQPRVSKTLALTGFDKMIQVYTDQDAALASFPH